MFDAFFYFVSFPFVITSHDLIATFYFELKIQLWFVSDVPYIVALYIPSLTGYELFTWMRCCMMMFGVGQSSYFLLH